jgi:hypothetical protein
VEHQCAKLAALIDSGLKLGGNGLIFSIGHRRIDLSKKEWSRGGALTVGYCSILYGELLESEAWSKLPFSLLLSWLLLRGLPA